MKTNLCHMLGVEYPIFAAPMGPDLTGPELVVAVSNAGGLVSNPGDNGTTDAK
jgi:NAD(P)H-dependent flavin oxidoreductase YrpB (nitropropane dioxygenase family)